MSTRVVAVIKRYRVRFAVVTMLLYVVMVPVTILVFPNNSLALALFVLFSGFTASVTTLGDLLVNAEEASKNEALVRAPDTDR